MSKSIWITALFCFAIMLLITAISSVIGTEWTTSVNGGVSGLVAGIAGITIYPVIKRKYG